MTGVQKCLFVNGWKYISEEWRGCIKEVYWRDPVTAETVQQRTAYIREKQRHPPKKRAILERRAADMRKRNLATIHIREAALERHGQ